jgi:hypothetical protein
MCIAIASEGVCIVTELRESSPVAGTNCVIKQCIRLDWDLTKSSSMEHDVVPLTGCCARGGRSERSAGGSRASGSPGPSQKSVHVRNAAAEVLLASYAPTNGSVHIPPKGTLRATLVFHCRPANRYVITRGLKT